LEYRQTGRGIHSAVVLDRSGIIRAVEFKGMDFDDRLGWPHNDIVGRPFMCIHESHDIEQHEVASGVSRVCQRKASQFSYRFKVNRENLGVTYEMKVDHKSAESDDVIVTYEKVAENASVAQNLAKSPDIHLALFEHLPIGILYQDVTGTISLINPVAQRILGCGENLQGKSLPCAVYDTAGIEVPPERYPGSITLRTGEPQKDIVLRIAKEHSAGVWIQANSDVVKDVDSGACTGVLTSFADITTVRETQIALQASTERAQIAVESAGMGVWDWIPEESKMVWDKKLFQLYGYPNEYDVTANDAWHKALYPDDVARVMSESRDMMAKGLNKKIDYRVVLPNGGLRHFRSQARIIKDDKNEVTRVIGVTHDVTNDVMAEKKLWELAYTDALTGVYSRAGLNFRLSRSVARALKNDDRFCVVMMGLTRFKEINDNYGVSVGDKILTEIGRRGKSLMEECDTIARVGGDEFILVLESVSEDELAQFAKKFREVVLQPITLSDELEVSLGAAVGVSIFPDDGYDTSSLQTNAGLAMHTARQNEMQGFMCYSSQMSEEVARKFNLKYQLHGAVKDQEFQLYYQPIIDLDDNNKVIGCEALIRWKDNHGKFVSPMEFIPVVEESGLIYELGKWINFTAVKQWKLWQHLVPDLKYISVNVSPRQLENSRFVDELVDLLREHDVDPCNLQLEITEGTLLQESLNADSILQVLANHGFRIAIDDFGTGYSSLAYLKRFNVDVIKIDRSFIIDIETDQSDRDIVSAILAMNKKLGFKTLVEGVETEKQNQIVHELGCDSAQGYLYGKPTFADEFAEVYIGSGKIFTSQ